MDCGIPFCHQGCPLGNLIPDWNDLVYRDRWQAAIERLHATNNFPEFTGRLCPAPCEGVVRARHQRRLRSRSRRSRSRSSSARSTKAGSSRAAAGDAHRQARRRRRLGPRRAGRRRSAEPGRALGHRVRARRSHRRAAALRHSRVQDGEARPRSPARAHGGGRRRASARARNVGVDIPADELRREFDAIVLAGGATMPRDLPVPGRELTGIHFAMEYLTQQNRRCEGDTVAGRRVDHRGGQARRHHRRRRHRRRLPRHRAPPGRRGRCTSSSCCRRPPDDARRRQPVAAVAEHLPRRRPRTKRAASGSTRSRPREFTGDAHGRVHGAAAASASMPVAGERPHGVQAGARQRVRARGRPRAAGDGLRRAPSASGCSTSSA